jgi:hypothetical protein
MGNGVSGDMRMDADSWQLMVREMDSSLDSTSLKGGEHDGLKKKLSVAICV